MTYSGCFCASPLNIYRKVVYLVRLNNYAKYYPVGISNRFPFPLYLRTTRHFTTVCTLYLPHLVQRFYSFAGIFHCLSGIRMYGYRSKSSIDKAREQKKKFHLDEENDGWRENTSSNTIQSRRPFFNNSFNFCFCKFYVSVCVSSVYACVGVRFSRPLFSSVHLIESILRFQFISFLIQNRFLE